MFEIIQLIWLTGQAIFGLVQVLVYAVYGAVRSIVYVIDSFLGTGRRLAGLRDRSERKLAQAEAKEAGFVAKRGGWRRPRGPYTHLRRGAVYVPRLTVKRSVPLGRVVQLEYRMRTGPNQGRATWTCAFMPTLFDAPYTIIQLRDGAIEPNFYTPPNVVEHDLAEFNERWVVHSTDEAFARWLIDEPVVERLMDPEVLTAGLTIELRGTEVLLVVPARSVRALVDYFWWAVELRDVLVHHRHDPPAPLPVDETDEVAGETAEAAKRATVEDPVPVIDSGATDAAGR